MVWAGECRRNFGGVEGCWSIFFRLLLLLANFSVGGGRRHDTVTILDGDGRRYKRDKIQCKESLQWCRREANRLGFVPLRRDVCGK